MNVGIRKANGQYIHVLSSDNLLLDPDAYANFAIEGHSEGATVLISSIGYFRRPTDEIRSVWTAETIPETREKW